MSRRATDGKLNQAAKCDLISRLASLLVLTFSTFPAFAEATPVVSPSLLEACGKSPAQVELHVLALASTPLPASGSGSSQTLENTAPSEAELKNSRVEELTKSILRGELELQKLNTEFRLETSLTSRWRQRRVFLYGETSALCTEISLIRAISSRLQLLRSRKAEAKFPNVPNDPIETDDEPVSNRLAGTASTTTNSSSKSSSTTNAASSSSLLPRSGGRVHGRLAAVNELQMVGSTVASAGDVVELGVNFLHYWQIRHRGFTPALYREKVHKIAKELDTLITQRQQAIVQRGPLNISGEQLESCEGKMLRDLRDLAMVDYMEYHAATKRFWTMQNTAFIYDFTKNGLGIAGNIISLEGSHLRRPRIAGSVGVTSAISGAMVLLQPMVGRVSGNISGTAARRLVSKELVNVNARTSDVFASDRQRLLTIYKMSDASSVSTGLANRLPFYAEQEHLMEDMNSFFKNERRRARGTLVENVTFASLVAPVRIGNAVTTTVGGWRYYNDAGGKERLYLAGTTAYVCGGAFSVLETARVQASEELRQYRLGKAHMRTGQRFKARIAALNNLQSAIK